MTIPVFIPVRDRLEPLLQLIDWLHERSYSEIYLVDNDSSYLPLQRFFLFTDCKVILTKKNLGHRSPWLSGSVQRLAEGRRYIVTDPDVVPDESCPTDVFEKLHTLLDKYPDIVKVGLGLRIDDIPTSNPLRVDILNWEKQFWEEQIEPNVYLADVDTTFALYRPYTGVQSHSPCVRTGFPYVAKHLPWYKSPEALSDEDIYYRARANQTVSNWDSNSVSYWKTICDRPSNSENPFEP